MHCLKELRNLEASGETPAKYKDYVPDNLEVKALLSRDKNITNDLYKAAVADTLIITMKVHIPHLMCVWSMCVAGAFGFVLRHRCTPCPFEWTVAGED